VITIGLLYFLAAVAASGIFVVAGWRSKHPGGLAAAQGGPGLRFDPLWGECEIGLDASDSQTDVGAAIRLVLKRLAPVMVSQSVHAEIAVPSGLLVRMRAAVLTDLLEELLAAAIDGAPASRLLMTGSTHGDRIHVGITDDMAGADLAVRVGSVRSVMERVAMRGGVLDVKVRPTEGTTMTLRLTAATKERQGHEEQLLPEPARRTVQAEL
jgi:hypothetical protein